MRIGSNALALLACAALVAAGPAWAQQQKMANGLIVNFGLMSAEKAVHAAGHSEAHPKTFPSGSQHILITVVEAKTHQRIADATVVVAVRSPNGTVEEKPLLHTQAAGLADYSELFVFGSPGTYKLRVKITPAHGPKSTLVEFTVHHEM
jgi:hypothetical protein